VGSYPEARHRAPVADVYDAHAMSRTRKRLALIAAPVLLAGATYALAQDYFEAAAFVARAAGMQGLARHAAALEADAVAESPVSVPWRGGRVRGRSYLPSDVTSNPVLVLPGVHAAGIDEPRLINFAREIAATGHPVTTAELPDLVRYQITPRSTDIIEDAAAWLGREWDDRLPADQRRVGLMGISFAGGLAIVAASRMGDRVAWIVSLGGHGDLPRTLRYLCTGQEPDGSTRPPHDYGVVIILLGVAERLVPPDQVEPLRQAIRSFLQASHVDMIDKEQGAAQFAKTRDLTQHLPEPARTYMTWVNDRNVAQLGPVLLPHVSALGGNPALSPERNSPPRGAVFLLHGLDDNVIPASESVVLARKLREAGAQVEQLATPLITHAEVDRSPGLGEIWRLVRFWAAPL